MDSQDWGPVGETPKSSGSRFRQRLSNRPVSKGALLKADPKKSVGKVPITNKVTPFLWFDGQAEAAARHYVSLFPNSRLLGVNPLPSGPGEGAALVEFELEGLKFTALDGGPMYRLTPAVSFVVSCESQEEIDHYWNGLLDAGGTEQQCGWLSDRFGLSRQVVPAELPGLMERASGPVMEALLGMVKIELGRLREVAGV